MVNTTVGVASIDRDLINVGRVLQLSTSVHIRKIVIPSAIPMIFTGLRLSLATGWMVLIAAEMLAQNLWTALIAGPEMEEETWKILKATGNLDDDSLQAIRQVYLEQMKPAVSEQERADLRQRYQLKRKEQA